HNALEGTRQITVRLKVTVGEKATELTRTIDVEGPGIQKLSLPVIVDEAESATFELTVSSTGFQPVRPGDDEAENADGDADDAQADADNDTTAAEDGLETRPTDTLTRTVPIHAYGAP